MSGIEPLLEVITYFRDAKDLKDALKDAKSDLGQVKQEIKNKISADTGKMVPKEQATFIDEFVELDVRTRTHIMNAAMRIEEAKHQYLRNTRLGKVASTSNALGLIQFAIEFSVVLPSPISATAIVTDILLSHFGGKSAKELSKSHESLQQPLAQFEQLSTQLLQGIYQQNLSYNGLQRIYNQFYILNDYLSSQDDTPEDVKEYIEELGNTVLEAVKRHNQKLIASISTAVEAKSTETHYMPATGINMEPFGGEAIPSEAIVGLLSEFHRKSALSHEVEARGEKMTKVAKSAGLTALITGFIPGAQVVALGATITSAVVWSSKMTAKLYTAYLTHKSNGRLDLAMSMAEQKYARHENVRPLLRKLSRASLSKKEKAELSGGLRSELRELIAREYIALPEGGRISASLTAEQLNTLMLIHVDESQEELDAFKVELIAQKAEQKAAKDITAIETINPLERAKLVSTINPLVHANVMKPIIDEDFDISSLERHEIIKPGYSGSPMSMASSVSFEDDSGSAMSIDTEEAAPPPELSRFRMEAKGQILKPIAQLAATTRQKPNESKSGPAKAVSTGDSIQTIDAVTSSTIIAANPLHSSAFSLALKEQIKRESKATTIREESASRAATPISTTPFTNASALPGRASPSGHLDADSSKGPTAI